MRIVDYAGMVSGYTMGMEPSGRECIVLVVKGTFGIPKLTGQVPTLLDEQEPLVEADTFSGEPGFSAPLFEVDYAPVKPYCDITLVGSAYAPGARAAETVQAGFKVGNLSKILNVHGDRVWLETPNGYETSRPNPFVKRSITYDIAYGGVDRFHKDESRHEPYMLNPVGIGYHKELDRTLVVNSPAPGTDECHNPVTQPDGLYKPMSLGPIGRGWLPRYRYGGTYDDNWLAEHFPFLPPDFDERYYQSAPEDQQTAYLNGGERVALLNVTEDGKRAFELPRISVPVTFFKKKSQRVETQAALDTLVLDPDNERFTMTWRASIKLSIDMHEVPEALVGHASRGWWRARNSGKTYHESLEAMIHQQKIDALEQDT